MMATDDREGKAEAERMYSTVTPGPPPPLSAEGLCAWRRARRLSQTKAGVLLGVSLRQIQRYEKGEMAIDPTVAALVAALDRAENPAPPTEGDGRLVRSDRAALIVLRRRLAAAVLLCDSILGKAKDA